MGERQNYMENFLLSESESEVLKTFLKDKLSSLLGNSGVRVLEYSLARVLREDPFTVFIESPRAFYNGMSRIFGKGADALLRLLFASILRQNLATPSTSPEELLLYLKIGDMESRTKLIKELMKAMRATERDFNFG